MLPHAAYALDALFSIGNAHTLLGIERLARALESCWNRSRLAEALQEDEQALQAEIDHVDALVHACYRSFGRARVFAATSMFYFVGAHGAELARGESKSRPEDRFLSSHHAELAAAVREAPARIACIASERDEVLYEDWVRSQLVPLNRGGFCDPAKANLYPCS
jgi:FADH2 O2-dependent halogenase